MDRASGRGLPGLLIRLAVSLLLGVPAFAQFGQNKVVLKDFDWKVSRTEHFDVYYYDGSAGWAPAAAQYLEKAYAIGRDRLGGAPTERRSFFLYANVNDMEQSNIVEVGDGTGGVTEPYKNRFMAYNDGTHRWLEDVITHEYGHIVEFWILTEGFWRSARILKTVFYPTWMMEGVSEYLTGSLDDTIEEVYLRDAATSGGLIPLPRLEALGHLKPHQVTLGYKEGSAAIRFLADEYGADKLKLFLEAFKTRFEVNSVLSEVIGIDLFAFDAKFREYLADKYAHQVRRLRLEEPTRWGKPLTVSEENIPEFNTSPVLSPDGRKLAFLSTREGFPARIYVKDLVTGSLRTVLGRPYTRVENISTGNFTEISRVLAISPDGRTLAFSAQKNHRETLVLLDLRTGDLQTVRLGGLMSAQEPFFSPDGRRIAFSAMKDGFTDIYLYDRDTGDLKNLTNDPRDDQSPAFSPDGKYLVYSSEINDPEAPNPHQRDLFMMNLADRSVRRLTDTAGSERDPIFSPDGARVLYASDPDGVLDIYELELATGGVTRLTRTVGGNFTPSYSADGKRVVFSSFRKGAIHVYSGPREGFLSEPAGAAAEVSDKKGLEPEQVPPPFAASLSPPREAPDRFSTDLFLPAFFFSSQGGLYWTSYWQGSDLFGNHNTSAYVNYNSGVGFLNYSLTYTYTRYRPQWFVAFRGSDVNDTIDDVGLTLDSRIHQQLFGVAYPFDRYHRVEVAAGIDAERNFYLDIPRNQYIDGRLVDLAFVRDTVNGRYLVATQGSRVRAEVKRLVPTLGGNQNYSTQSLEGQQYFPVGGESAVAARGVFGQSIGPNHELFHIGGVGWVRGFQRSDSDNTGSRFALANLEYRFPLVPDLNYYFWYISPDLYFKAIYGRVFMDSGYFWNDAAGLQALTPQRLLTSYGLGIQVHTFVLQRFPFVLTADWAKQANTRNNVFYVYLGPLF